MSWSLLGNSTNLVSQIKAVSWGSDRIDLFSRGFDSFIHHNSWDGSQWGTWESLGSPTGNGLACIGDPAPVTWGPNNLNVFTLASDGGSYQKSWNGSGWGDWISISDVATEIFTTQITAVSWGVNRIDLFALGTFSSVYHDSWNGSSWSGWSPIGPSNASIATSEVAAIAYPNHLDIFVLDVNHSISHNAWSVSGWGEWQSTGGVLISPPTVVSWSEDRIDLFALAGDHFIWHQVFDENRNWGGWSSLNWTTGSPPGACTSGTDQLSVFAIGNNSETYQQAYNGSVWSDRRDNGGVFLSRINGICFSADDIQLFTLGFHGDAWTNTVDTPVGKAPQGSSPESVPTGLVSNSSSGSGISPNNESGNSGHGPSTGAIDGIIGGLLGIALLASVAFIFYLLRRNKKYHQGSLAPERGEVGARLRSGSVEY